MVECPGTDDDRANLRLGLMIHARGMTTHVPPGGSVRSGAVELFLAGAQRIADPGAEFAVHSWSDEFGLEPRDYAPDSPENRTSMCNFPPDKVLTRCAQRRTASLRPGILSGQAAAKRKRTSGVLGCCAGACAQVSADKAPAPAPNQLRRCMRPKELVFI